MLVNGQVEKTFFMAWDFILSQGKLKKLNVGGLLTLKAERNICSHSDLDNIIN